MILYFSGQNASLVRSNRSLRKAHRTHTVADDVNVLSYKYKNRENRKIHFCIEPYIIPCLFAVRASFATQCPSAYVAVTL